MLRQLSTVTLVVMMVALFSSKAHAQFENQKNYAGAHIGLGYYSSGLVLGLDYERGITEIGQAGPGIIGIGGLLDFSSYSYPGGNGTYFGLGVSGMYHFVLQDRKWDPFIGLVLGYQGSSYYSSGLFPFITGGIRYFFSDNLAVQARLGWDFYYLAVGVDYKF